LGENRNAAVGFHCSELNISKDRDNYNASPYAVQPNLTLPKKK